MPAAGTPTGTPTCDVREANARHMLHPMIDPKVVRQNPPLIIERGEGVHVWDIDGKRYLDTVASLWNVNVGHNRREIIDAITAQLGRLAYYSTFQNTSNPPAIELSARLARMFAPEKMRKVLFSSGGSDAVETALKLARQYWKLEGQGERTKFLSLKLGYHGVHFGGASINGNPLFRSAYEPLMPGCFQIESPYLYRNPWNETDPERLAALCLDELDRAIQYQGPQTIAAFVAEPVQGAGGVIVPPASYWPGVRRVLDKYGILLISDEIVTGFGRIGAACGARAWGVAPDIMAIAKGLGGGYLPLGAAVYQQSILETLIKHDGGPLTGHTFTAHTAACAAGVAVQRIVQRDGLVARVASEGEVLKSLLRGALRGIEAVGDIRGRGFFVGVEFVADRATRAPFDPALMLSARIGKHGVRRGLMCYPVSGNVDGSRGDAVILAPPYITTREQLQEIVGLFADCVRAALLDVGRA